MWFFLFDTQTLILRRPSGAPHRKYIRRLFLGWTNKIDSDIFSSTRTLNFIRGEKCEIWPRFLSPVAFQALGFRDEEKQQQRCRMFSANSIQSVQLLSSENKAEQISPHRKTGRKIRWITNNAAADCPMAIQCRTQVPYGSAETANSWLRRERLAKRAASSGNAAQISIFSSLLAFCCSSFLPALQSSNSAPLPNNNYISCRDIGWAW